MVAGTLSYFASPVDLFHQQQSSKLMRERHHTQTHHALLSSLLQTFGQSLRAANHERQPATPLLQPTIHIIGEYLARGHLSERVQQYDLVIFTFVRLHRPDELDVIFVILRRHAQVRGFETGVVRGVCRF